MCGEQVFALRKLVDGQVNLLVKPLPLHGGFCAFFGAVEELGVQGFFQLAQAAADGGHGNAKLFSAGRQAAALHDRDEQAQVVQVHRSTFLPKMEDILPVLPVHFHFYSI